MQGSGGVRNCKDNDEGPTGEEVGEDNCEDYNGRPREKEIDARTAGTVPGSGYAMADTRFSVPRMGPKAQSLLPK